MAKRIGLRARVLGLSSRPGSDATNALSARRNQRATWLRG